MNESENKINFAHLHVHTGFSLLDGSAKIDDLILETKNLGMNAIAITDHGAMYGAIDFYKSAKRHGIKPIIGCEVYIATGSRLDKTNSKENKHNHLVLLAKNNKGYENLIKLVSYGFLDGFYYRPRIDIDILKEHSDGLICLSACLAGAIPRNITNNNYEKAKQTALLYNDIFGYGNFYLELQNHGIADQKIVNDALIKMRKETNIPLVCTNDVHYIKEEDAQAHDILLCIQTGKTINDENRMKYEGEQFYLKSQQEMYELFSYVPEALENSQKIANKCDVSFNFNEYKLPVFDVPDDGNAFAYLTELCNDGLKFRYENVTQELQERLDYELETIKKMGFIDYFLIVWDFIKYAKDNGIIVGPGRGSAAGSIVAYALRITDIDPIKYNLIFERFLNLERISMPDIDIDFCYERRQEVINYVIQKYGAEKVSQIITFGTMAAKNAIRDVGRALDMPYSEVDSIAKMIPIELKMTIKKALEQNPSLKKLCEDEPRIKYLIDMSMKLEGLPRHASTHAAGVVICDRAVMDYVPLNQNDGVTTTQYAMTTLEELGLLKMDFLGLRTLTVIKNALEEINRLHKLNLTVEDIDCSDKAIYDLISTGNTYGVFQLESTGMKKFMKDLKPENIEDIIAGVSLYRPGPMDFIPKYLKGKNSIQTEIKYTHPLLEPILKTTYGCIVYQEQVMQIVQELAGYTLGRSDLLRRVMGKKKGSEMELERNKFIYGAGDEACGCVANGISAEVASQIFDEMEDFAKYAFNKSHAAAYAVIACQTAWLKAHYPVEFMSALLTSVSDNTDKIVEYISDLKRMGIELLPPDINEGLDRFTVSESKIRFSLTAIKNIGTSLVNMIIIERNKNGKYESIRDIFDRLNGHLSLRAMEGLIKSGALNSLGNKKSQNLQMYRNIHASISQEKKNIISGQLNLFSAVLEEPTSIRDELPEIEELTQKEILQFERDSLGTYVSGHPIDEYIQTISKNRSNTTFDFVENDEGVCTVSDKQKVIVGGILSNINEKFTKNGNKMAFITLEDDFGLIEILVFPQIYEKYHSLLVEGSVVIINGVSSFSEEQPPKILCDKITSYSEIENKNKTLWLKIPIDFEIGVKDLGEVLQKYLGAVPVIVYDESKKMKFNLNKTHWVNPSETLFLELETILPKNCIVIK